MPVDIHEITLNDEQKRRIAQIAEQSGRPWPEVLDEQLSVPQPIAGGAEWPLKDRYIEDYDQWRTYFQEWISKQTSHNPNFDDSRESIYD